MSDNLPLEVQEEIMKRLPMKPLIQFRSVSKAWKSLIDSSHFIAHYSSPHTHLLVMEDPEYAYPTYVSLVDGVGFSFRIDSMVHPLVSGYKCHDIIGSSHGLVCFYGYRDTCNGLGVADTAILWNISIRKAVAVIVVPDVDPYKGIYYTHLGFGVCPETVDPKIVKVTRIATWNYRTESLNWVPWQVEVFTLSTGVWRSPRGNLPRKSIKFGSGHGIDGVYYWLATDMSTINDGIMYYNLIITFDMVSEEFREINFPNSLVHKSWDNLWFSSLRKSLVLLEHNDKMTNVVVWMMDHGASNSFAKLYTIHAPHAQKLRVWEFRKSGEPIVQIMEDPFDPDQIYKSSLFVYEPNSKRFSELGISSTGAHDLYSVRFYMETLLLLDQPEFAVYDKGERYIAKQRPKTKGF